MVRAGITFFYFSTKRLFLDATCLYFATCGAPRSQMSPHLNQTNVSNVQFHQNHPLKGSRKEEKSLSEEPETHFMCGSKRKTDWGIREWIYANDCVVVELSGTVCFFFYFLFLCNKPSEIISFEKCFMCKRRAGRRRTSRAEDTGFRRKILKTWKNVQSSVV